MEPGKKIPKNQYRRILLKLSGKVLGGEEDARINPVILADIAKEIKDIHDLGVGVAVVIGAGNIFRGSMAEDLGIKRVTGDYMGMLATVINSLALQNALEAIGVQARVMCSFSMKEIAEPYIIRKALDHLEHGRVVIASGGTGHPFFTTDTAASLRGIELDADVLLKATRVDGVYSSDPERDATARKLDSISYIDVLKSQLGIMDVTAVSLCMDNNLPIIVFNLLKLGSLKSIVTGKSIGTIIS
jgi:uridylate kinase